MNLFKLFARKPKPILVFISGNAHALLPDEAIEAFGQDGSKLVITRASSGYAIEVNTYAKPRKQR